MEHTRLVYMENMSLLGIDARVVVSDEESGKKYVVLDQTIFYPQGGGQPFDQGYIRGEHSVFKVEEVRFIEGIVRHIGAFESGSFNEGARKGIPLPARPVCRIQREYRGSGRYRDI